MDIRKRYGYPLLSRLRDGTSGNSRFRSLSPPSVQKNTVTFSVRPSSRFRSAFCPSHKYGQQSAMSSAFRSDSSKASIPSRPMFAHRSKINEVNGHRSRYVHKTRQSREIGGIYVDKDKNVAVDTGTDMVVETGTSATPRAQRGEDGRCLLTSQEKDVSQYSVLQQQKDLVASILKGLKLLAELIGAKSQSPMLQSSRPASVPDCKSGNSKSLSRILKSQYTVSFADANEYRYFRSVEQSDDSSDSFESGNIRPKSNRSLEMSHGPSSSSPSVVLRGSPNSEEKSNAQKDYDELSQSRERSRSPASSIQNISQSLKRAGDLQSYSPPSSQMFGCPKSPSSAVLQNSSSFHDSVRVEPYCGALFSPQVIQSISPKSVLKAFSSLNTAKRVRSLEESSSQYPRSPGAQSSPGIDIFPMSDDTNERCLPYPNFYQRHNKQSSAISNVSSKFEGAGEPSLNASSQLLDHLGSPSVEFVIESPHIHNSKEPESYHQDELMTRLYSPPPHPDLNVSSVYRDISETLSCLRASSRLRKHLSSQPSDGLNVSSNSTKASEIQDHIHDSSHFSKRSGSQSSAGLYRSSNTNGEEERRLHSPVPSLVRGRRYLSLSGAHNAQVRNGSADESPPYLRTSVPSCYRPNSQARVGRHGSTSYGGNCHYPANTDTMPQTPAITSSTLNQKPMAFDLQQTLISPQPCHDRGFEKVREEKITQQQRLPREIFPWSLKYTSKYPCSIKKPSKSERYQRTPSMCDEFSCVHLAECHSSKGSRYPIRTRLGQFRP